MKELGYDNKVYEEPKDLGLTVYGLINQNWNHEEILGNFWENNRKGRQWNKTHWTMLCDSK